MYCGKVSMGMTQNYSPILQMWFPSFLLFVNTFSFFKMWYVCNFTLFPLFFSVKHFFHFTNIFLSLAETLSGDPNSIFILIAHPSLCPSQYQCDKSSQTALITLFFYWGGPHKKLGQFVKLTFLKFDFGLRANYIVSTLTLSGILGSFQTVTDMFSTSIARTSSLLNFLTFQTMSSYIFSAIFGISGSFQNFTGMFSTSISHTRSMLTFIWPFNIIL